MQIDRPLSDHDLDRLKRFLEDDAPESSMAIDELHGFLAALICSLQMVMPSEWTPHVWGGKEPEFETMEQAQDVMELFMRLNNDVTEKLSMGDFDPLFAEETLANGLVVLDPHGWCEGFVRGMQLQPDAWRDDELREALMPIIVLSDTIKDNPKIDELLDNNEAIEKPAEVVPKAVVSIFRHQRRHFAPPSQRVRRDPKIGRNDPCPCGSGKKYKKCCGAATQH